MGIIVWLQGKKTYFAMALVILAFAGRLIMPDGEIVWKWIDDLGIALGGVGIVDKIRRMFKDDPTPTE